MKYRTKQNDRLDQICFKHYGRVDGTVEAVLDGNRGLANLGPLLPAGIVIELPELVAASTSKIETVRLWD